MPNGNKQVYHIRDNVLAKDAICAAHGSALATIEEMINAYKNKLVFLWMEDGQLALSHKRFLGKITIRPMKK